VVLLHSSARQPLLEAASQRLNQRNLRFNAAQRDRERLVDERLGK
jgi:hypothetical protein